MASNPQLTVKQFAAITLNQNAPPWHLGKLLQIYNQKSIALRPSIVNLSAAQAVMFVAVRSAQVVSSSANNADTWTSTWGYLPNPPSGYIPQSGIGATIGDLEMLAAVLGPVGGSIVYLPEGINTNTSRTQVYPVVGFAGTFAALANLNTQIIPFLPALWTDADRNTLLNLNTGVVITAAGLYDLLPNAGTAATTLVVLPGGKPVSQPGKVSLGALGLYVGNNNSGVRGQPALDAAQLLADHLQVTCNTMASLLLHTFPFSSDGVAGAVQDVNAYLAWLNYLGTVSAVNVDSVPSGSLSLRFNGNLTIPQITLQPLDKSQPTIVISAFTLQPDGTTTGGTVSQ
jgi:hypothetical protein